MNIKQALKQKNVIIREIEELNDLICENNSIIQGNQREFDTKDLIDELRGKSESLVSLKSAIQRANVPVFDKIFRLSELKNLVKVYNSIPTNEGKQKSSYNRVEPQIFDVQIGRKEMRDMINKVKQEIYIIQEELDVHNAITEIFF